MTYPDPDPYPLPPGGPRVSFRIPLKPCGCLAGDGCDCAAWIAEVEAGFANPIPYPLHMPPRGGPR